MDKFQSLADFLGLNEPPPERPVEDPPVDYSKLSGKEFADAVLKSRDFKNYIINGLSLGYLSSAIVVRLMDYAWGKPPDRIEHEHSGKVITEVRRVVVRSADSRTQEHQDTTTKTSVH